MALPALPVLGQNPWYTPRNNWDVAVQAELDGRLSAASIEAAISGEVDPIAPDGGVRAVGKGELVIFAPDYGPLTGDAKPTIQAALDAAYAMIGPDRGQALGVVRGATVRLPPGSFECLSALKMYPYVTLEGAGFQTSQIYNNTTHLFHQEVGDVAVTCAIFRNLWLRTGTAGGHIFLVEGGGYYNCRFSDVQMTTGNTTSSIWKQTAGSYLDNLVEKCRFFTSGSRTVPAWDIKLSGNTCNSNQWVSSWCHGRGTTLAPFFRIESTNAWHYNNTFRDLVGEQNGGGFIHLYSIDGVIIENCPDWDLVGTYQADVIRLTYGTFGQLRSPKNVRIESSYRLASGGLAAGVYDVAASAVANRNIRIHGVEMEGGVEMKFSLAGDASVVGVSTGYRTLGAADVLTGISPKNQVANSASASAVTLPATAIFGREFHFKNIGAGVLTITGTVDGVVNPTLNQWDKMTVRSNGTAGFWFTV